MSNMVVRTNVLALNAHRNLGNVGRQQANSSARLSSGFRINSAADDAAGLGISEKMRAQIRGLDQASRNAQDGISLIQTAEGAMTTVNEMVNRIRELVVQASNDTNAHDGNEIHQSDRQQIQAEINQLLDEIDATASRTEFNTRNLLDGSLSGDPLRGVDAADIRALINRADFSAAIDLVNSTQTTLETNQGLLEDAEVALVDATAVRDRATALAEGLQGRLQEIHDIVEEGLNDGSISNAAADAEVAARIADLESELGLAANTIADVLSGAAGVAPDMADLNAALGTATNTAGGLGQAVADAYVDANSSVGTWADLNTAVTAGGSYYTSVMAAQGNVDSAQTAADNATDALDVLFRSPILGDNAADDSRRALVDAFGDMSTMMEALESYESGGHGTRLWFQIGANRDQGVHLTIGSVGVDALSSTRTGNVPQGFSFADLRNDARADGAGVMRASGEEIQQFLTAIDLSLSHVTSQRSNLGAMQNRLEFTIQNLDIASQNLSAAESRIRDADMAAEMMRLTQSNVLQQAATSMLAQANQAPQSILQLIG